MYYQKRVRHVCCAISTLIYSHYQPVGLIFARNNTVPTLQRLPISKPFLTSMPCDMILWRIFKWWLSKHDFVKRFSFFQFFKGFFLPTASGCINSLFISTRERFYRSTLKYPNCRCQIFLSNVWEWRSSMWPTRRRRRWRPRRRWMHSLWKLWWC